MNLKSNVKKKTRVLFTLPFLFIIMASLSCGVSPKSFVGTPTSEETLTPSNTSTDEPTEIAFPTVTSSPTETDISTQDALLGIEEPINIEDINIQILDAYPRENLENESQESTNTTKFDIEFPCSLYYDLDWIAQNSLLVCGVEEYKAITKGLIVGDDGRLRAHYLSYDVQQDIDYMTCVFQIKRYDISLATFFE